MIQGVQLYLQHFTITIANEDVTTAVPFLPNVFGVLSQAAR